MVHISGSSTDSNDGLDEPKRRNLWYTFLRGVSVHRMFYSRSELNARKLENPWDTMTECCCCCGLIVYVYTT